MALDIVGGRNRQWVGCVDRQVSDQGGRRDRAEDGEPGDVIHLAVVYSADDTIQLFRNGEPYGQAYRPDVMTDAGKAPDLQRR